MLALSRACLISCLAVVEEVTRKALYNVPEVYVCVSVCVCVCVCVCVSVCVACGGVN